MVIQIGDANRFVEGQHNYQITYKCSLYDDGNEEMDSMYWNILPHQWATPIQEATMIIHMPKEFDSSKAEFIAGSYGEIDMEAIRWTVEGNTIIADTTRVLETGEGATFNVILPEGYFIGERTTEWMFWLMMLLMIAAPLISILLWLFFGRDPKVIKTVEFYPPEGINSAEVGYIVDGYVDSKDIVSLVIYWANKGYLSIREDGKKNFTLIKVKDLPETVKTYEYTMFYGLFNDRDQVSVEELKEDFYGSFEATKGQLRATYTLNKKNRIFTHSSIAARSLGTFIMLVPIASLLILGTLGSMSNEFWAIMAIPAIFLSIFGFSMIITAYDKKDSFSKGKVANRFWLCALRFGSNWIAGIQRLDIGYDFIWYNGNPWIFNNFDLYYSNETANEKEQ